MVASFVNDAQNRQCSRGEGLDTPLEEGQGGGCCRWFVVPMDIVIAEQSLVCVSKATLTPKNSNVFLFIGPSAGIG